LTVSVGQFSLNLFVKSLKEGGIKMTRYNEDKIDAGIKTIKRLAEDLEETNNEELREQLWKLQREATLLMEFINHELYEEEELKQVV
jgi:hypothetical protein